MTNKTALKSYRVSQIQYYCRMASSRWQRYRPSGAFYYRRKWMSDDASVGCRYAGEPPCFFLDSRGFAETRQWLSQYVRFGCPGNQTIHAKYILSHGQSDKRSEAGAHLWYCRMSIEGVATWWMSETSRLLKSWAERTSWQPLPSVW